jgi:hypothetical protein
LFCCQLALFSHEDHSRGTRVKVLIGRLAIRLVMKTSFIQRLAPR